MEISNNNDLEEVKISQNSAEDDEKHDQEETEREQSVLRTLDRKKHDFNSPVKYTRISMLLNKCAQQLTG